MKSLELLRQEESQQRVYRTKTNIIDSVRGFVVYFRQKHPQTDWSSCCELLAEYPTKIPSYDFTVRHMIQWGKADARVIEDAFQISLPQSIHELYSQIQEAVLFWRDIIHILNPNDAVSWERQNREWEDTENGPFRLIRFIESRWYGGSIGIRKSVSDDKWRIYYAAVDDGPGYEDKSHDGFDLADDLDSWLQYMMANDGAFSPAERHHVQAARLITRIA